MANPDTLLTRFFGLHRVKPHNNLQIVGDMDEFVSVEHGAKNQKMNFRFFVGFHTM